MIRLALCVGLSTRLLFQVSLGLLRLGATGPVELTRSDCTLRTDAAYCARTKSTGNAARVILRASFRAGDIS
jgi:hypothetical protein